MREVSIKLAKCNRNFAPWPFSSEKCVNIMLPLKCRILNFDILIHILLTSNIRKAQFLQEMYLHLIALKRNRILPHLTQYLVLALLMLSVRNHKIRLQADHFLDPQTYSKGFVNNKPVFDRKLTVLHSFLLGVKMITCILAGKRNQRSGLTYCNVTDICCFYEITSSTQPTCNTFYVYNELK